MTFKKLHQTNPFYTTRTQSIDSIETYVYGTSKDLVSEKEEIKCNNIIKEYKK